MSPAGGRGALGDFARPSLLSGLARGGPARDQFRLARLQLYNWGTFQDYHDLEVPAEGLLLTGPSGSGKTTVLDAVSTMLVPQKWVEYNQAAREVGRRDRSCASYVKGAWGAQLDGGAGEVRVSLLRDRTTWSAIALTFRNAAGRTVALLQLFWILRAGQADVRRHYLILDRDLGLADLDFGGADLKIDRLLAGLDGVVHHGSDFAGYAARLRGRLGIANETTLRLLQKTQSMKSIESLNSFLKEFMLDEPGTFEAAGTLADTFNALKLAHDAVVAAREQVELLTRLSGQARFHDLAAGAVRRLDAMLGGLAVFFDRRTLVLRRESLEALRLEEASAARRAAEAMEAQRAARARRDELAREYHQSGAQRIEGWERDLASLEESLRGRVPKRLRVSKALRDLGWDPDPRDESAYAALRAMANDETELEASSRRTLRDDQESAAAERRAAEAELAGAEAELEALKRGPGNIPASHLAIRARAAEALSMPERDLPFLGELVDLKPGEVLWRGAAERVLADLALTMAVPDPRAADMARHALSAGHGGLLAWLAVEAPAKRSRREPAGADGSGGGGGSGEGGGSGGGDGSGGGGESGGGEEDGGSWAASEPLREASTVPGVETLLSKLEFKKGRVDVRRILSERIGHAAVADPSLMDFHAQAVVPGGLAKWDEELMVKDDRRDLGDARHFVLGFDNRAKRAAWEARAGELRQAAVAARARLEEIYGEQGRLDRRRSARAVVLGHEWADVDTESLRAAIANLRRAIENERADNVRLGEAAARLEAQGRVLDRAIEESGAAEAALGRCRALLRAEESEIRELAPRAAAELDYEAGRGLEAHVGTLGEITLKNIERIKYDASQLLHSERARREAARGHHLDQALAMIGEFRRRWPAGGATDLEATLESVPGYLDLLAGLIADGLPKRESDFHDLLHRQSIQQVVMLSQVIARSRSEIAERLEQVNLSLAGIPFNRTGGRETYLRLKADRMEGREVAEFGARLRTMTTNIFQRDHSLDEATFEKVQSLVADLGDPAKAGWRRKVLDVRDHFNFTGVEADSMGTEIESYRSGSGKSGGQRQKLAATCLAAALRYQLGGGDVGYPRYATVVFDEAFDKIDSESTLVVMNIFSRLGFQMILATPNRGLQTAEPYIGGAAYVSIEDRNRSFMTAILYDRDRRRLIWPEAGRGEEASDAAGGAGAGPEGAEEVADGSEGTEGADGTEGTEGTEGAEGTDGSGATVGADGVGDAPDGTEGGGPDGGGTDGGGTGEAGGLP